MKKFVPFLLLVAPFIVGTTPLFSQHFQFNQSDGSNVNIIQEATINGESLVEGDEVGAFSPGENGVCGGAGVIPAEFPDRMLGFEVWGAEGQNPGFRDNDVIEFRLWDASEEVEVVAEFQAVQGDGRWHVNGVNVGRLTAEIVFSPIIAVDPANVDFGDLLVGEETEAVITISNDGNADLTITGLEVAGEGFSVDDGGQQGGMEFNWEFVQTDVNMLIIIQDARIDGEQIANGDFVGAFTTDGVCAGYSEFNGQFPLAVSAWQTQNNQNNGFSDGEVIELRMWDTEAGMEIVSEIEHIQGEMDYRAGNFKICTIAGEANQGFNGEEIIEPGGQLEVSLIFAPEEGGEHNGTLTISSDDPDDPEIEVELVGVGLVPVPDIALSSNEHDFGTLFIGESAAWSFDVLNEGHGVLTVNTVTTVGDHFTDNINEAFSVQPGGSQAVEVTFEPGGVGDFVANIVVSSNDPDEQVVIVRVSGAGEEIPVPNIVVDPGAIDFGTIMVGVETNEVINISNNGDVVLNIEDVVVDGAGFSIDYEGGGEQGGEEFGWEYTQTDNNHSCLVQAATINGESVVPGDYIGTFTPAGLCAGFTEVPDNFAERGLGVSAWGEEAGQGNGFRNGELINLRIWDTDAGLEVETEITVIFGFRNYAVGGVMVCEIAGEVNQGRNTEIEPGSSIEVTVTFAPDDEGQFAGTVTILSDDPDEGELVVDLVGDGELPPPDIAVNARAHNFGMLFVGDNEVWNLEVSNEGGSPLVVESVVTTGNYFSDNADGFEVAAGGTEVVGVTFAPEAAGDFAGQVVIVSNDGDEAEVVINLSGSANEVPVPVVSVDPRAIDFGDLFVGEDATESITISNFGTATLVVDQVTVEGSGFGIQFGGRVELEPDEGIEIPVTFAPEDDGVFEGTVTVSSNDEENPEVEVGLLGIGNWFPVIAVDPADLIDFETVQLGQSGNASLRITNEGRAALTIENIVVDGAGFAVDEWDQVVAPDGVLELDVSFTPQELGGAEGTVTIHSDARNAAEVTVNLIGEGILPPTITLSEDAHDFGSIFVGEEVSWTFTVGNEGDAVLIVDQIAVVGQFYTVDFNEGFTLAPGATQEVTATFAPEDGGNYEGTVTLVSNDPNNGEVTVDLIGIGNWFPVIAVDPADLINFETVQLGQSGNATLRITNEGRAALTIENIVVNGTGFAVDEWDQVIAPDGVFDLTVSFTPEEVGGVEGTVTIHSDARNAAEVTVNLIGEGILPPTITLSEDAHDFGSIFVGEEVSWTFTVGNEGDAVLIVDQIAVVGQFYTVDFNEGFTLAPGATQEVTATFAPEDGGNYEGTVTLVSNDPNNGEVEVGLRGIGNWFPVIGVNPDALDFGRVIVGEVGEETLTINNHGLAELNVELTINDNYFNFTGASELVIAPESSAEVNVTFLPEAAGNFVGTLIINSDDRENGEIEVNLVGEGFYHPDIEISDDAYDFGNLFVGEEDNWTFTIMNVGGDPLEIEGLEITGNYYSIDVEEGFILETDQSQEIIVNFAPEDDGQFDGRIAIISNDPDEGEVEISLIGVGNFRGPEIVVSEMEHDFGSLFVGTSRMWEVEVTNTGDVVLGVESVVTTGDYFTDNADRFNLEPDATQIIEVTFAPEVAGDFVGQVVIVSNDGDEAEVAIDLSGSANEVPVPVVSIVPMAIDFGDLFVGENATESITISNFGTATLIVDQVTVEGAGFGIQFEGRVELEPDDGIEIPVTFAPEDDGVFEGTVTVSSNDEENPEVEVGLLGTGNWFPIIRVNPDAFDFGRVAVGELGEETLTIINDGLAELNVELTIDDNYFNFEGASEFIIDPESSTEVNVTFLPEEAGNSQGTLIINSDDRENGEIEVNLAGEGFYHPDIEVSDEGYDFGNLFVGEEDNWTFTVMNVGGDPLEIEGIEVRGNYYSIDVEEGFVLETDQSREITVNFAPEDGGQFNGQIAITSNDPDEGEVLLQLTGRGLWFPVIAVDPDDLIDFETVQLGQSSNANLRITNVGRAALTIQNIVVDGAGFAIDEWDQVIAPDGVFDLAISFTPEEVGGVEGTVTILSDANNAEEVTVNLSGEGILPPTITLSEDTHDFGELFVGDEDSWIFTVGNEGDANLIVDRIDLTGQFYTLDVEDGFTLVPGTTQEIIATFAPEDDGNYEGTVTLVSNDPNNSEVEVGLSGIGNWFPIIRVNPDAFDFGRVAVGELGEETLTIINDGLAVLNVDLTIDDNYFDFDGASEFVIDPESSAEVNVTFLPEASGSFAGTLIIISDDRENGEIEVNLTGEGFYHPDIEVSDEGYNFGTTFVGEQDDWGFTIENVGGDPLVVESVTIIGDYYSIDIDEGFTLETGESQSVGVNFAPEDGGQFDGQIAITSNDPDEGEVLLQLTGTGLWYPIIAVDPADLIDFETVQLGQSGNASLRITNEGLAALTIENIVVDGAGFAIDEWDQVIAPGGVLDLAVSFTPEEVGGVEGTVTIHSDARNAAEVTVNLIGEGILPPTITLSEDAHDFGSIFVGEEVSWTFTVGNEGDAVLIVDQIAVVGQFYTVDFNEGFTLAPGATQEVTATFAPEDGGNYEGTVTLVSNDPNNGEVTVDLIGIGNWFPVIAVDPADLIDFETVQLGQSGNASLRITNEGRAALTIENIVVNGTGFAVDEWDQVVAPDGVLELDVSFTPEEVGGAEGTVTILSDARNAAEVTVNLLGEGILPPTITLSEETHDFGSIFVGEEDSWTFIVGNDGDADLIVDRIDVAGQFYTLDVEGGFTLVPGATLEITATFAPEDDGNYEGTVTLVSNDPNNGEYQIVLNGTGIVPNDPPAFVGLEESYQTEEGTDYSLRLVAEDPEDDPMVLSMEGNLPDAATFTDNEDGTGTLAWNIGFNDAGDYNVTFTVEDDYNHVITQDVRFEVLNVNQLPEFVNPINNADGAEGQGISFEISAVDPDGQDVTIDIDFEFDSDLNQIDSDTWEFVWTPGYEDSGDHEAVFTAIDEEGGEVNHTVAISIEDVNRAPYVDSPIVFFEVNEDADRTAVADINDVFVDPDGDELTFGISTQDIDYLNLEIFEDVLFVDPDEDYNGETEVTIYASDGYEAQGMAAMRVSIGAETFNLQNPRAQRQIRSMNVNEPYIPNRDDAVDDVFILRVNAVNDAPEVLEAISNVTVDEDAGFTQIVDLDDVFEDIDGDRLEWTFNEVPVELNISIDENNILSFEPENDYNLAAGVEIVVTATDIEDVSVDNSFVLVIMPVNDAPVLINEIADIQVEQSSGYNEIADLDDVFTDVDLNDQEPDELSFQIHGATEELNMGIDEDNILYFHAADNFTIPDGLDITVTATDNSGESAENVFNIIITLIGEPREIVVDLRQDWNFVSINVVPDEEFWIRDQGPDVILMFEQLRVDEDNHHIIIIKNEDGRFYYPGRGYNSIAHWDLTEGLQVKVDEAVSASWSGEPIPFDTDIPIALGWNMIPYYPAYELSVTTPDFYAISQIAEQVVLLKDDRGRFASPLYDYSNLDFLSEGEAYKIKTSADVVLNYPEPGGDMAGIQLELQFEDIETSIRTTENMSILVNSTLGNEVSEGKHIAAFSSKDKIVGKGSINSDGQCGLVVWGDDSSTEPVEGLMENESFELRLIDNNQSVQSDLRISFIQGEDLVYRTDDFLIISAELIPAIPDQYYLSQNYPNPFNSTTVLPYGLPETTRLSISIFDISGRIVESLVNGDIEAGYHSVSWDASTVATGVYLVKMESGSFSSVRKVILVR